MKWDTLGAYDAPNPRGTDFIGLTVHPSVEMHSLVAGLSVNTAE